ncbi:adenylylsulfate kinase [Natranaerovirga pectinivora]|uniref:Adenylyl-sulfate kinase n=1 Tax=Natranaerovirga pectinivora TaxID=682400 RepID=A0A4R3ML12_9FIRM|nr:adenylylsulfate kinase [Natranaerovirga pectinivora]
MDNKSTNIVWHKTNITKQDREKLLGQKGVLLWFTGLSGSGKSTIATALEQKLWELGKLTYLLDGDNVRHGLNGDLGFSEEDRKENIRRIKEVAKLFVDAGVITIASFIAPFREDRDSIRRELGDRFVEVFVNCPIEVCASRDPKGLYEKVKNGEIRNFTGVDSPYEVPLDCEVEIKSDEVSVEEAVDSLLRIISNL